MTDGPQIECTEGSALPTTPPYSGCIGNANQWVASGQYQEFEIVSYGDGYWIARVHEAGGGGHDVARIASSSQTITRANATFEQAWGGYDSDPYLPAIFSFRHPQYMIWGNGFQEWPNSGIASTQQSYIYPTGTGGTDFCPTHYMFLWAFDWELGLDPRSWYAGDSVVGTNMVCNAILFMYNYVPYVSSE